MSRTILLAPALALFATGCSSNPLIGSWQNTDISQYCAATMVFNSSSMSTTYTNGWKSGSDVTYNVGSDKTVTVVGSSAAVPGGGAVVYNVPDSGHMVLASVGGLQCNYVRAK